MDQTFAISGKDRAMCVINDVCIIIPIYNCENYIQNCIKSVCDQTYKNISIIIVDDGSTDQTGIICDKYAELDDRIKVIHKKNEGLVRARKTAVKNTNSKYLYFLDGDDWIENDAIEKMLQDMINCDADVVIDNIVLEYPKNKVLKSWPISSGIYNQMEFLPRYIYSDNFFSFGAPINIVGKLYKREKYKEYQERVEDCIKIGEDVAVTLPYIHNSQRIVFRAERYSYHYRQISESMVHSCNNPDREKESQILFNILDSEFKEKFLNGRLGYYYFSMLIGLFKNESKLYVSFSDFRERIDEILESKYYADITDVINWKSLGFKYRILYWLVRYKNSGLIALYVRIGSKLSNVG